MNLKSSFQRIRDLLCSRSGLTALAALCVLSATPVARAASVYFIGNSVTDTVNYYGLAELAASRGKTQPWGRHMIPGAPLQVLWENPNVGFSEAPYGAEPNALPNYTWDHLSLQPFDRQLAEDLDYIQRYTALLFGITSPTAAQASNRLNSRLLIYGRWPRQDEATRVGGPRSYDTLWKRTYTGGWDGTNESADYASDLTLAVRDTSVSGIPLLTRTFMLPVGHVMYALNQQMKAGQIAGYTDIFQVYADGIHLNNVGAYITACTYFAVLYGETPVGLPVPSQYGAINSTLAAQIQATVWSVVQAEPLSGVAPGGLLISTAAVAPGYIGQPYTATLVAGGGVAPRSFSLTAGALPDGVTLASNGSLSGTPTVQGNFPFTVTVTDSTQPTALTVTRDYVLTISVDTVPVITTPATLPAGSRGARYAQALSATGGDGLLVWTVTSGSLPPGIQLGGGGALVGSALTAGNYTFSVRVDDADVPADSDSRTFTLSIGAPVAETLLVSRTTSPVRVDGDLSETHWNLTSSAARQLLGAPDNTTTFAVLWDADNLYLAARVADTRLFSAGTGAERDAIEFFLDAFNDKQAIFNSQHRQFRVALDGALFERGGRSSGVKQALLMVPGGYQLEMSIPWSNLGITPVADQTVIGLDLANDDSDTGAARQHYTAFAFSDPFDPRPSQFGNAILTATTVSGTGGEPLGLSGTAYPAMDASFDLSSSGTNTTGVIPLDPSGVFNGAYNWNDGNPIVTTRYYSGRFATTYNHPSWALDNAVTVNFILAGGGNGGKIGIIDSGWANLRAEFPDGQNVTSDSVATPITIDYQIKLTSREYGAYEIKVFTGPAATAPTEGTAIFTGGGNGPYLNSPLSSVSFTTSGQTLTGTASSSNFKSSDAWIVGSSGGNLVAAPSFAPLGGTYASAQLVTLTSATAGATIHYTNDGSAPSVASPVYSTAVPISATTTLRALAVKPGSVTSAISGGIYAIQTPYETWSASIPWNGADSSPAADPNGDGIKNLLAYALGGDPLADASASLPVAETSGNLLTLTYTRARSDITYVVQTSSTLATDSWTSAGVDQGSGAVGASVTASVPMSTDARRFLRLQVVH